MNVRKLQGYFDRREPTHTHFARAFTHMHAYIHAHSRTHRSTGRQNGVSRSQTERFHGDARCGLVHPLPPPHGRTRTSLGSEILYAKRLFVCASFIPIFNTKVLFQFSIQKIQLVKNTIKRPAKILNLEIYYQLKGANLRKFSCFRIYMKLFKFFLMIIV